MRTEPRVRFGDTSSSRRRLSELVAARVALVVVCKRCRHEAVLFPNRLAEQHGSAAVVSTLAARMRCGACKSRGSVQIRESVR
jgi:hypothetical protein